MNRKRISYVFGQRFFGDGLLLDKLIFAALILFLLTSCDNPFGTRNAEPPENQSPTNWKQPTQPSDVLDNLRNAIQDENITNYLNSLTNTPTNGRNFGFRPDQIAIIRFPGVWDNWNIEMERTYLSNIFQAIPSDSLPSLIFIGQGTETPLADSTIIIHDYELYLPHARSGEQFPRLARGRVEFRLARNPEGFWAIFNWIDIGVEGSPSWSEIKAAFVQ